MWRDFFCAGTNPRYWWLMGLLMALYFGAILFAMLHHDPTGSPLARAAVALAPVLPVVGFVLLELRRIRATDELRQRIELEACMITLAIGVPLLLAIGLLDNAGIVRVDVFMAAPIVLAIYVPAQVFAHWRYR
jgi:hypothetical protein